MRAPLRPVGDPDVRVESQHGTDVLKATFPELSGAASRVVFHTGDGRLDDPAHRSLVTAAVARLGTVADVSVVSDPFDPQSPALSADGRTAYATVQFTDQTTSKRQYDEALAAITPARDAGVQAELSGLAEAGKEVHGNEAIGILVAIVVLLVAFGSVVAMGLPIVTALLGVGVAMFGVGIYAGVAKVPTVSEMLAVMIGLGVGIDDALFVVTRHRQHLHEGMSPEDAAGHATATAGQSVLFAGTTVCIAIFGLLLAGVPAVTAIGVAIGLAVISAMAIAVTLLPGLLGLAGRRIDRLAIHRRESVQPAHATLSGRWAHHVGRRPWRYAIATFALLALAADRVHDAVAATPGVASVGDPS